METDSAAVHVVGTSGVNLTEISGETRGRIHKACLAGADPEGVARGRMEAPGAEAS